MKISKDRFFLAASKVEIPKNKIEALWNTLENENSSSFQFSKLMFYFGALIIIVSMTWFLFLGWGWLEGGAIFFISVAYSVIFASAGAKFWKRPDLKIPAGLLITIAVCMVP